MPLNENGNHWTLSLIDPVARKIDYFDPQHSNGERVMKSILDFIEEEHVYSIIPFDRSMWTLKSHFNTPKQTDSHSCGVLTILTALCVALDRKIDFGMGSIPEIRKKIKFLLSYESLIDPYVYNVT